MKNSFVVYGLKSGYGIDEYLNIKITDSNDNTIDKVNVVVSGPLSREFTTTNSTLNFKLKDVGFKKGNYLFHNRHHRLNYVWIEPVWYWNKHPDPQSPQSSCVWIEPVWYWNWEEIGLPEVVDMVWIEPVWYWNYHQLIELSLRMSCLNRTSVVLKLPQPPYRVTK